MRRVTLMSSKARFLLPALAVLVAAPTVAQALPSADAQARANARYWELQGRTDLAQQAMNKILLAHPDDLRVLFEIGQLDLRTNQITDAQRILKRMQALSPQGHDTEQMALAYRFTTTDRLKLASVERLLELHRPADAIANLKALFPDGPPDGDLGVRYFDILDADSVNWTVARDGLAAIAARYPDDPRYQLALADVLAERSQTRQQAIDIASGIARQDGPDQQQAMAVWRKGILRSDPVAPARRSAREYLTLVPSSPDVRKWLAQPEVHPVVTASRSTRQSVSPRSRAQLAATKALEPMRQMLAALQKTDRDNDALAIIKGYRAHAVFIPDWLDGMESDLLSGAGEADLAAGRSGAALTRLERAQQLSPDDPWARYHLAQLYGQLGLPDEARRLMQDGVRRDPDNTDSYFAQSLLLASLDDIDGAQTALNHIPPDRRSDGMQALQRRLLVTGGEERASRLAAAGDKPMAAATLRSIEPVADQPYQLAAIARAWRTLGQPARGEALLRRRVEASPAPSSELLLAWAHAADDADDQTHLQMALARLHAKSDLSSEQHQDVQQLDAALVLRDVDRLRADGRDDAALTRLTQAIADDPGNVALRDARGDLYRDLGRYPEALEDDRYVAANSDEAWRRQRALSRADAIEARRDGYVAAGSSLRAKPGDAGISDFTDIEIPVEARLPIGYAGHLFAHADSVHVAAGTLPDNYDQAALYGQVQARGPGSLSRFPGGADQSATGVALALGYESDHWRFDVGSTPIGFPVTDIVGGVRYDTTLAGLDFTADLSRRPVTSSYLSYAGAVDPATGAVWGGVRQNGLSLRLAHYGSTFSVSGSLLGSVLTGRNVPSNPYLSAHAGVDWRVFDQYAQRFYVGLSGDYWHYGKNLSQYTFGHGGYYSPQQYQSIGVPVEWDGRLGRFTYVLRGSLSYSHSVVDAAPFYPGHDDLQALALTSPLPAGYSAPVYGAGGGTGLGKSISGGIEYALAPKWAIGANFDIDRSAYYAPNFFNLYLRRTFLGHDVDGRDTPPQPPRPYSSY